MRVFLILAAVILTGCSTPGVQVWGGVSQAVDAGGYSFKVNHTLERAEAYRTSFELRPKAGPIFIAAVQAMEQASGCKVDKTTINGDVARIVADLKC